MPKVVNLQPLSPAFCRYLAGVPTAMKMAGYACSLLALGCELGARLLARLRSPGGATARSVALEERDPATTVRG